MLVLTRKIGETIVIDDDVRITVVHIKGKQVRIGVDAPKETKIHREEIYQAIQDENRAAMKSMATELTNLGSNKGPAKKIG